MILFANLFISYIIPPSDYMGHKITIYLSEPTKAILRGMEGETSSSKVRVALEAFNHTEGAALADKERLISALRRQILRRDELLRRIERKGKLTHNTLNTMRDILEGI
jgi:hypothetical protein